MSPLKRLFLSLAIAAQMFGCDVTFGYYDEDRAVAETAVHNFHQFYNDAKYSSIYALMGPQVQQSTSEANFSAAVGKVSFRAILNKLVLNGDR